MADAFGSLIASRYQILEVPELEEKGPEWSWDVSAPAARALAARLARCVRSSVPDAGDALSSVPPRFNRCPYVEGAIPAVA